MPLLLSRRPWSSPCVAYVRTWRDLPAGSLTCDINAWHHNDASSAPALRGRQGAAGSRMQRQVMTHASLVVLVMQALRLEHAYGPPCGSCRACSGAGQGTKCADCAPDSALMSLLMHRRWQPPLWPAIATPMHAVTAKALHKPSRRAMTKARLTAAPSRLSCPTPGVVHDADTSRPHDAWAEPTAPSRRWGCRRTVSGAGTGVRQAAAARKWLRCRDMHTAPPHQGGCRGDCQGCCHQGRRL